jgi:plasmid maintenance system antidote protein VapI
MNFTYRLIEKVKHKQGLISDYAVAKLIGVKPQKISNWKAGQSEGNAEYTLRLLAAAGMSVEDALSEMTKHPATAGGALNSSAKQCILC